MTLTEMSDSLWQERRLTEKLVFKLDAVTLWVETGRWRWLVMLADEARGAADELARHRRRWYQQMLGGADADPALDPALEASSPRNEILAEHDAALAGLRRELRTAARTALESLSRCQHPAAPTEAVADDELGAEILRIAIDGLVAVAGDFAGLPPA
jgi:hypothetical protein